MRVKTPNVRSGAAPARRASAVCVLALLALALPCALAQSSPVSPSSTPQAPAGQPPAASVLKPSTTTPPATTTPPDNPSDQATETIVTHVNEVDLVFTVTDKKGHFVTGLNLDNFGLLDNHMPPEKIIHFTQQTNLPLRVGIMLDTSSSIRGRFEFEQQAATNFLLQVLHRNDRAFVEGFDVQIDLAQGFTNNIDLLNQGVQKLRPGGGTALFDSLYSTCKDQMLTLRENTSVRKTIILVSDGDDNYSHALESDAIKECQRSETTIYAISTNVSPSKDKGDDVLAAIAAATGGRAFYPTRFEDVAAGFASIEEELRSQYLLQYTPAEFKQDGAFRTIYLQAKDPRYHVRAHTGYFAPRAAE